MKKHIMRGVLATFTVVLLIITVFAHSGRTDSSGGHNDNNNVSGLGSYHYHCGGNPAHLHTNGVCPYSASSGTAPTEPTIESTTETPYIPTTEATTEPTTTNAPKIVEVSSVKITPLNKDIYVDDSIQLSASVLPSNAENKTITWSSSNALIATITSNGTLKAIAEGKVTITATSSNNKKDTITINIKATPTLASPLQKSQPVQKSLKASFNDIKIKIDGSIIAPKDTNGNEVEPFIVDGTTYLPVRAIAEAMGYDVEWDKDTQTIILIKK